MTKPVQPPLFDTTEFTHPTQETFLELGQYQQAYLIMKRLQLIISLMGELPVVLDDAGFGIFASTADRAVNLFERLLAPVISHFLIILSSTPKE